MPALAIRNPSSLVSLTVTGPPGGLIVATTRSRAVLPTVSVSGVHKVCPLPYWSSVSPVATVVQLAPLSLEACRLSTGLATPPALAWRNSIPLTIALYEADLFTNSSFRPWPPLTFRFSVSATALLITLPASARTSTSAAITVPLATMSNLRAPTAMLLGSTKYSTAWYAPSAASIWYVIWYPAVVPPGAYA